MPRNGLLQEMKQGSIVHRFGINELVDTADTETKGTTLDTSAVHVISNQQDELKKGRKLT
jgi:hypothetical protein